jgi:hypothetical protein
MMALSHLDEPNYRKGSVEWAKASYLSEMQRTIKEAKAKGQDVHDNPPTKIPLPNRLEKQLDPDEHLLCFDYLYFTSTHRVCAQFTRNPIILT